MGNKAVSAEIYAFLAKQKSIKRDQFLCPCCETERYGETGEKFQGEIICLSCLEGLVED